MKRILALISICLSLGVFQSCTERAENTTEQSTKTLFKSKFKIHLLGVRVTPAYPTSPYDDETSISIVIDEAEGDIFQSIPKLEDGKTVYHISRDNNEGTIYRSSSPPRVFQNYELKKETSELLRTGFLSFQLDQKLESSKYFNRQDSFEALEWKKHLAGKSGYNTGYPTYWIVREKLEKMSDALNLDL